MMLMSLLESLLNISVPLNNLFNINLLLKFTCQKCFEISYKEAIHIGLNDVLNSNSIESIIQNNRTSLVEFNCNICKENTNHTKNETFNELPDVLMIQVKRFEEKIQLPLYQKIPLN